MKRIAEFLSRFRNLRPPQKAIEEEAKKIIMEKTNLSENSFSIIFKKPNLTVITQNPVLKNEIFLFRESILSRLKNKFGPNTEIKIFFR